MQKIHATTVLGVIHEGKVALGADGQATMGNTIAKSNVRKVRKLYGGKILAGFAGSKAQEKLKNSLIFGTQDLGRGQVVYLANDPLFRGFWQNGKLLFGNAVFVVGN